MAVEPEANRASNHFCVIATIAEAKPLRYTPSGLPAVDLELRHESEQPSLDAKHKIALSLKAIAFGTLAERLVRQGLGSVWQFSGYLASARSRPEPSRQLVFHILDFQSVPTLS